MKNKDDLRVYPEEIAGLQGSSDDVFLNRLDLTWMKGESVGSGDYSRVIHKLPVENAEDDGTVTYSYNSSGFRSGEFTSDHLNNPHVLFLGCSETEGYGANDGEYWPSILHETISNKSTTSGFFNLGRGGWGWEKIIANSSIYFDKYGVPDYMFIMLPNISRFWRYLEDEGQWSYIQRYVNDHKHNIGERSKSLVEHKNLHKMDRSLYLSEFIRFVSGWKTYLRYCESLGIKVLWSTWFAQDSENIKAMYDFKNFVYIGKESDMYEITAKIAANKKSDGTYKSNDLRRRDGHHGTIYHKIWADKFAEKAKELGWEIV